MTQDEIKAVIKFISDVLPEVRKAPHEQHDIVLRQLKSRYEFVKDLSVDNHRWTNLEVMVSSLIYRHGLFSPKELSDIAEKKSLRRDKIGEYTQLFTEMLEAVLDEKKPADLDTDQPVKIVKAKLSKLAREIFFSFDSVPSQSVQNSGKNFVDALLQSKDRTEQFGKDFARSNGILFELKIDGKTEAMRDDELGVNYFSRLKIPKETAEFIQKLLNQKAIQEFARQLGIAEENIGPRTCSYIEVNYVPGAIPATITYKIEFNTRLFADKDLIAVAAEFTFQVIQNRIVEDAGQRKVRTVNLGQVSKEEVELIARFSTAVTDTAVEAPLVPSASVVYEEASDFGSPGHVTTSAQALDANASVERLNLNEKQIQLCQSFIEFQMTQIEHGYPGAMLEGSTDFSGTYKEYWAKMQVSSSDMPNLVLLSGKTGRGEKLVAEKKDRNFTKEANAVIENTRNQFNDLIAKFTSGTEAHDSDDTKVKAGQLDLILMRMHQVVRYLAGSSKLTPKSYKEYAIKALGLSKEEEIPEDIKVLIEEYEKCFLKFIAFSVQQPGDPEIQTTEAKVDLEKSLCKFYAAINDKIRAKKFARTTAISFETQNFTSGFINHIFSIINQFVNNLNEFQRTNDLDKLHGRLANTNQLLVEGPEKSLLSDLGIRDYLRDGRTVSTFLKNGIPVGSSENKLNDFLELTDESFLRTLISLICNQSVINHTSSEMSRFLRFNGISESGISWAERNFVVNLIEDKSDIAKTKFHIEIELRLNVKSITWGIKDNAYNTNSYMPINRPHAEIKQKFKITATKDADGKFELSLPEESREFKLLAMSAPSFPVRVQVSESLLKPELRLNSSTDLASLYIFEFYNYINVRNIPIRKDKLENNSIGTLILDEMSNFPILEDAKKVLDENNLCQSLYRALYDSDHVDHIKLGKQLLARAHVLLAQSDLRQEDIRRYQSLKFFAYGLLLSTYNGMIDNESITGKQKEEAKNFIMEIDTFIADPNLGSINDLVSEKFKSELKLLRRLNSVSPLMAVVAAPIYKYCVSGPTLGLLEKSGKLATQLADSSLNIGNIYETLKDLDPEFIDKITLQNGLDGIFDILPLLQKKDSSKEAYLTCLNLVKKKFKDYRVDDGVIDCFFAMVGRLADFSSVAFEDLLQTKYIRCEKVSSAEPKRKLIKLEVNSGEIVVTVAQSKTFKVIKPDLTEAIYDIEFEHKYRVTKAGIKDLTASFSTTSKDLYGIIVPMSTQLTWENLKKIFDREGEPFYVNIVCKIPQAVFENALQGFPIAQTSNAFKERLLQGQVSDKEFLSYLYDPSCYGMSSESPTASLVSHVVNYLVGVPEGQSLKALIDGIILIAGTVPCVSSEEQEIAVKHCSEQASELDYMLSPFENGSLQLEKIEKNLEQAARASNEKLDLTIIQEKAKSKLLGSLRNLKQRFLSAESMKYGVLARLELTRNSVDAQQESTQKLKNISTVLPDLPNLQRFKSVVDQLPEVSIDTLEVFKTKSENVLTRFKKNNGKLDASFLTFVLCILENYDELFKNEYSSNPDLKLSFENLALLKLICAKCKKESSSESSELKPLIEIFEHAVSEDNVNIFSNRSVKEILTVIAAKAFIKNMPSGIVNTLLTQAECSIDRKSDYLLFLILTLHQVTLTNVKTRLIEIFNQLDDNTQRNELFVKIKSFLNSDLTTEVTHSLNGIRKDIVDSNKLKISDLIIPFLVKGNQDVEQKVGLITLEVAASVSKNSQDVGKELKDDELIRYVEIQKAQLKATPFYIGEFLTNLHHRGKNALSFPKVIYNVFKMQREGNAVDKFSNIIWLIRQIKDKNIEKLNENNPVKIFYEALKARPNGKEHGRELTRILLTEKSIANALDVVDVTKCAEHDDEIVRKLLRPTFLEYVGFYDEPWRNASRKFNASKVSMNAVVDLLIKHPHLADKVFSRGIIRFDYVSHLSPEQVAKMVLGPAALRWRILNNQRVMNRLLNAKVTGQTLEVKKALELIIGIRNDFSPDPSDKNVYGYIAKWAVESKPRAKYSPLRTIIRNQALLVKTIAVLQDSNLYALKNLFIAIRDLPRADRVQLWTGLGSTSVKSSLLDNQELKQAFLSAYFKFDNEALNINAETDLDYKVNFNEAREALGISKENFYGLGFDTSLNDLEKSIDGQKLVKHLPEVPSLNFDAVSRRSSDGPPPSPAHSSLTDTSRPIEELTLPQVGVLPANKH